MPRPGSPRDRRRRSELFLEPLGQTGTMRKWGKMYLHFADFAGIVTSPVLLFKCQATFSAPGVFQMPTPDHATASLPDDPALLSIEGPIPTIRLIARPPSTRSLFRSQGSTS